MKTKEPAFTVDRGSKETHGVCTPCVCKDLSCFVNVQTVTSVLMNKKKSVDV